MARPATASVGVYAYPQSSAVPGSLVQDGGSTTCATPRPSGPASISSTVASGEAAARRDATTQPAEPPPTMT